MSFIISIHTYLIGLRILSHLHTKMSVLINQIQDNTFRNMFVPSVDESYHTLNTLLVSVNKTNGV